MQTAHLFPAVCRHPLLHSSKCPSSPWACHGNLKQIVNVLLGYFVPFSRRGQQKQDSVLGSSVLCPGWAQALASFRACSALRWWLCPLPHLCGWGLARPSSVAWCQSPVLRERCCVGVTAGVDTGWSLACWRRLLLSTVGSSARVTEALTQASLSSELKGTRVSKHSQFCPARWTRGKQEQPLWPVLGKFEWLNKRRK